MLCRKEVREEVAIQVSPTKDQIQAEVQALKEMQPSVRHYTAFGDDNWGAIDAQISTLVERLDEDEVYDRWEGEETESELDNALYALRWLEGEEAEAPSVGWAPLVS